MKTLRQIYDEVFDRTMAEKYEAVRNDLYDAMCKMVKLNGKEIDGKELEEAIRVNERGIAREIWSWIFWDIKFQMAVNGYLTFCEEMSKV